jgi:hypothetical protein
MAAIGNDAIGAAAKASPLQAKYGESVDSRSAYEILNERAAQAAPADQPPAKGKASKPAPQEKEKPGWFKRFVNSRGFQTFLNAMGRELVRSLMNGNKRRR